MTGPNYARVFWIGAAGVLVLAALIGISSLLRSDFSETDWQILLTLLALLVASATAVAGLTIAERGHTIVGWGAVGVALAAFLLIGIATWDGFDSATLARLAGSAAFALVATLLGTTQLVLHRGSYAWIVVFTWAAAVFAFLLSTSALWSDGGGETWQVAACGWILALVGWLLLPVLQRFTAAGAPITEVRVLASLDDVELVASRSDHGVAVHLQPGERLALRKRASG